MVGGWGIWGGGDWRKGWDGGRVEILRFYRDHNSWELPSLETYITLARGKVSRHHSYSRSKCFTKTIHNVLLGRYWFTSRYIRFLRINDPSETHRDPPSNTVQVLSTFCLLYMENNGRSLCRDRKDRGPVSQQAWHDKDPSTEIKTQPFNGNGDLCIWM